MQPETRSRILKRKLLLVVIFFFACDSAVLRADPALVPPPKQAMPVLPLQQDTSLFETSPWIKKIDIIKTNNLVRVIVRANAATECFKQREIERIFDKDVVRIILRLKRPQGSKDCPPNLFDYEEKVYESPLDLAPANIWILGYEGWHKLKVQ